MLALSSENPTETQINYEAELVALISHKTFLMQNIWERESASPREPGARRDPPKSTTKVIPRGVFFYVH